MEVFLFAYKKNINQLSFSYVLYTVKNNPDFHPNLQGSHVTNLHSMHKNPPETNVYQHTLKSWNCNKYPQNLTQYRSVLWICMCSAYG